MASLGARQRWKDRKEVQVEERERERHIGRERKEEQAGKELVDICAEMESGDGHPRVQCRIKRSRGPAEIDASRGSSLIYAFITVNNASPFASGLSLSLSRQSTPFHLVCSIHRGWLSFDTASISQSNHHPHQGRLFLKPFEILLDSDLFTIFSFFIQAKCVGFVG